MKPVSDFSINWEFVTHFIVSQYNENQSVVFFTTGKYLVVDVHHSVLADMFTKHKELQHGLV